MALEEMLTDKSKDKEVTIKSESSDKDRFVYIMGVIDEDVSKETIEKLLELQSENPLDDITMIINSCGGEVYPMFAIGDTMELIYPDVRTICIGMAASAASYLFLQGTIGKRFMTKHSSLMIHQASGGSWGTSKDITIQAKELEYLQDQMAKGIAERSNLTEEDVEKFIDRDFYIRPEQAINYGMCEGLIESLS